MTAIAVLEELDQQWAAIRAGSVSATDANRPRGAVSSQPSDQVRRAIVRAAYDHVVDQIGARDSARFRSDRDGHLRDADKRRASAQQLRREVRAGDIGRFVGPTEKMLVKRGVVVDREAPWFDDLVRDVATAILDAQDVGIRRDEGELEPRPTTDVVKSAFDERLPHPSSKDLPFSALADQFMSQWLAGRHDRKDTNTEPQKRSTLRLFSGHFKDRPIRAVRHEDAASFFDALRLLDPHWSRSSSTRTLTWEGLIERFGNHPKGLSDATVNRHLRVLQEVWSWANKRGHCDGSNPFEGFQKRLRAGVNVRPYVAWEDGELRELLAPPSMRVDLLEVVLVGMFTGMRLDEIASLTWSQVRRCEERGTVIHYFQVEDAKTPAGNRKVPVHRSLGWLLSRTRGLPDDRLWPTFNEEGRGKKPGNDASKEFSQFKIQRGFDDRTKTFHSFRKNVTRMMEQAQVPENDWAQIFGHERGFTYRVYNPDGISMTRRAEIIDLIDYPNVVVPHPIG